MNYCRETAKMGVPPGNRPAAPRDWFPYLNGRSQGSTSEDARLPARRAYSSERRTATSVVAVTPRREFMKYPVKTGENDMPLCGLGPHHGDAVRWQDRCISQV
jgi:hypothetical protein